MVWTASSLCGAESLCSKFDILSVVTWRWYNPLSIWWIRTLWDHPFSIVFWIYQARCFGSFTFSKIAILCDHGICADTICTNSRSGYARANLAIYFKLRTEKPVAFGKDNLISFARLSTNLLPHVLCSLITVPMEWYSRISSLLTCSAALYCAARISCFICSIVSKYSPELISITHAPGFLFQDIISCNLEYNQPFSENKKRLAETSRFLPCV